MAIAEDLQTAESTNASDAECAKDVLLHQVYGAEAAAMKKVREELSLTHAQCTAILAATNESFTNILEEVSYFRTYMGLAQFATFIADEVKRNS